MAFSSYVREATHLFGLNLFGSSFLRERERQAVIQGRHEKERKKKN
jgi:hypothetical protein